MTQNTSRLSPARRTRRRITASSTARLRRSAVLAVPDLERSAAAGNGSPGAGFQFLLKDLHGLCELRIASGQRIGGRVVHEDVGRHAVVLEVLALDVPETGTRRAER